MEVLLLARCFRALIGLSVLFGLGSTVSQPKVAVSLEAESNASPISSDGKNPLRTRNGQGIYVSDAKVGVIVDGTHLQRSDPAPEPSKDGKDIAQPSFMRRGPKPEADDDAVLDDLSPDDSASLAELDGGANLDESFNWWDRRRRRRRYDCRWTEWQGWKACTVNCGAGEKQRDRQTDGPHWGGKVCSGEKSEYSTCNLQNCAVDCEWNHWGAWGPCSKTCGGGNRVRQRGALPFTNRDGGAICPDSQKKKAGVCNTFSCPIPCAFAAWGLWGGCSRTCDSGLKRRTREQEGPKYGGAPCIGDNFLDEKCNSFSCPIDCAWNVWGGWGQCSRTCGGGVRLREREMLSQASNGGAACPGSPAEILACNVEDCPQDCKWAQWHEPGPCSRTCGGGAFKRHRARFQEAIAGGAPCTGPNTEIGPCNVEPCAVDCLYSDWAPFTACTQSCGGGVHTAERNGTAALHGGIECSTVNMSKEEECNQEECPAVMVEGGAHPQTSCHSEVFMFVIAASVLLNQRAA